MKLKINKLIMIIMKDMKSKLIKIAMIFIS